MSKKYTFRLVIKPGDDEFWEDIPEGRSGIEEAIDLVSRALDSMGIVKGHDLVELKLVKFEDDD